jgi:hypothetical protein
MAEVVALYFALTAPAEQVALIALAALAEQVALIALAQVVLAQVALLPADF